MARGWESKAVESQLEEAAAVITTQRISVSLETTELFEVEQKRLGLKLMKSQLTQQLANARSVTHRQMIHQSLRAIDEELQKFE